MSDLRDDLHSVFDGEPFSGEVLLSRVLTELERPRRGAGHRWTPVVAAGLTLALVATLLVVRLARDGVSNLPHHGGPTNACAPGGNTSAGPAGSVLEYQAPADITFAGAITAGADCSLWFIGNANAVVKVTTSGAFTQYPIPGAFTTVNAITSGPGGGIWFTESRNNYGKVATGTRLINVGLVGTLSPTGIYSEYTIPAADSNPQGITLGPDANLWVIDNGANKVFRMTTTGRFTAYAIPTPNSDAVQITKGPDGNLWFTERNAGKVARVTTSGVITEFPFPDAEFMPIGIAAGSDGNVWITGAGRHVFGGGKVARMTTSGVLTESSIPPDTYASFEPAPPGLITAGPDGNLWFTVGLDLDRVTPAGVISQYKVSAYLEGIAAGPDGNIWFTERDLTQQSKAIVGRLVP